MNARKPYGTTFMRIWLFACSLTFIFALLPQSVAHADHCPEEPWNLADCLRTPGYREWYVTVLITLGVTPTLISQILAEASKTSLTDEDVNKFIRDQILQRLKNWLQKGAARQAGSTLATRTADILDSWSKDSSSSPPAKATTPSEPPVEHIYDHSPGRIISGDEAKEFLKGTGALDKLSRLRHGADWDDVIEAMKGDPGKTQVTDFAIKWNDDGTPNLDELVFVMPDTAPGSPPPPDTQPDGEKTPEAEAEPPEAEKPSEKPKDVPPAKVPEPPTPPEEKPKPPAEPPPPDLKELLERNRRERNEAQKKIDDLKKKALDLLEKLKKKEKEWNHTRVKGFWGGIWDMIDVVTDVLKVKQLATKTFGGAYLKDLVKNAIKALCTELHADGVQLSDLKKLGLEDVIAPTGLVPSSVKMKGPGETMDMTIPGGGIKQLIQNWLEKKDVPGGQTMSDIYGPGETALKGTRDVVQAKQKCEALRVEMNKLRTQLYDVGRQMQDARMDYDVADSAVKNNQEAINELKKMFPNRFRNY